MNISNSLSILILLFMASCEKSGELDVQGHRGARGLMPENTLPAFEKAIELGVTTLELDVVVSKDNKVVISHEPYMNHIICSYPDGTSIAKEDEKGINLYEMTYDSIAKYDCGLLAHPRFPEQEKIAAHKPTLSQVIDLAERKTINKIRYNIEIKSDPSYDGVYSPAISEMVALVVAIIKDKDIMTRTTLQSFDVRGLEQMKIQAPTASIALLIDENEIIEDKLESLSFKPEIISPYFKLLNKEGIMNLQQRDFLVIPWTVNEIEDMKRLIDLNVDGLITDYPDRLLGLLNDR